jgi:CubicO group peptidase (beta-lactamase class C family)
MQRLERLFEERIPQWCERATVPGYVIGVFHDGDEMTAAWGTANLNTKEPMTVETRWLLGSITKVATASLILRLVERKQVSLDEPVTTYLPDFRLAEDGAAESITIRHCLNHTNGVDADALFPTRENGPASVRAYVEELANFGTLFPPGQSIHYSNPGYSVAARVIEVTSGMTFHDAVEKEIFATVGMSHSCTSAEQAILHRTAVGTFPGARAGDVRPTKMFMLPSSGAGAGTTLITTVRDLLAFGRAHLRGGTAPSGKQLLPRELVDAMQASSFDLCSPNVPAIGLGWWLVPMAGCTALWHGGGSPGGRSSLVVIPEHDLVIATFGNGERSPIVHDEVLLTVFEEVLGQRVESPFEPSAAALPPGRYAGTYSHFQNHLEVRPTDKGIHVRCVFEPYDAEHERFMTEYLGGKNGPQTARMKAVREGLFVEEGVEARHMAAIWGRKALLSFHGADAGHRPRFCHCDLRYARRRD